MNTISKHTARVENELIFQGQYSLTGREQKIILYLISKINPIQDDRLIEQLIPIKELEELIKGGKKYGGFYAEMERFSDTIMTKMIKFPTDFEVNGKRIGGRVGWFQSIVPMKNEDGQLCLRFLFSSDLEPFLLDLKKYTRIEVKEIMPLRSGFSVRMFQLFKSHRCRLSKYQKESKINYTLEQLKSLLSITTKHSDYRNFKKHVVDTFVNEINAHTSIKVKAIPLKKGRKVVSIDFVFSDRRRAGADEPTSEGVDISRLTFAQRFAFDKLVSFGVVDGIANQFVTNLGSSETVGFEDVYFGIVLDMFTQKSKVENGRAGVFVKWFKDMGIYSQGNNFAKIMEQLASKKKELQKNEEKWDNRMIAKDMTYNDFIELKKSE